MIVDESRTTPFVRIDVIGSLAHSHHLLVLRPGMVRVAVFLYERIKPR